MNSNQLILIHFHWRFFSFNLFCLLSSKHSGSKGVAKCISLCKVSPEKGLTQSENTIGIVMTPLASKDAVSSIESIPSPSTAMVASKNVVTTLIDMVSAKYV